jgi:hypothetical protein
MHEPVFVIDGNMYNHWKGAVLNIDHVGRIITSVHDSLSIEAVDSAQRIVVSSRRNSEIIQPQKQIRIRGLSQEFAIPTDTAKRHCDRAQSLLKSMARRCPIALQKFSEIQFDVV